MWELRDNQHGRLYFASLITTGSRVCAIPDCGRGARTIVHLAAGIDAKGDARAY